jgi:hypothetical protein
MPPTKFICSPGASKRVDRNSGNTRAAKNFWMGPSLRQVKLRAARILMRPRRFELDEAEALEAPQFLHQVRLAEIENVEDLRLGPAVQREEGGEQ